MNSENEEQAATTEKTTTASAAAVSASSATVASRNNGRLKTPSNFIGRHRLQAAISHLEQQIQYIQSEIDDLDTIGGPSTVCNEIISGIESVPDPLLPMTKGPVDVNWERWFGGASSSRSHRRWI
ncbi:guanine nucleotide-binding protein subunit gamma 1-like [Chenopodium quinoa]|uniref:guanine nucleotide-binding protein subunit gamma 1-like n=1 Tax=Chenopodium quinoa TaxID=63459 RepID=UPI000B791D9E|nr:guanine nucleotide-binding protein subunit gamma 1-like [Chenopodium quinoa]